MTTANIKISQLPPLSSMGNATIFPVVDAGSNKSVSGTVLRNFLANVSGTGNTLVNGSYTVSLEADGTTTFPTGGHIGATKGGTMLDAGYGYNTSLTTFYANANYAACVTGDAQTGKLYITAYNDGGPNPASEWTFDKDGNLTLPQGSTIGETTTTTVISPPGALAGQSLVLRGTSPTGITSNHPGGFAPGDTITITVTPDNSNPVTGTIDYTFTGCTSIQLGRALTGTLTFTSQSSQTVTWTVPALSSMTTFTFTLSNPSGIGLAGVTTLTLTGTGSSEASHIHLISGNPTTVDLYLGDDDQYVKIEKNGGNVVIGTDTNAHQWTFGTDGVLTLPNDMTIDASDSFGTVKIGGSNTQIRIDDGGAPPGLYIRTDMAGADHGWLFGPDGDITFPDGTIQTTAYTGQNSGAIGTFFVVVNDDGTVSKSTDGVSWIAAVDLVQGINRVATNGVTVAMLQSGQISWTTFAGLEASTYLSGNSSTSDQIGGQNINWNQIDYAGGYFVAVGSYTPTESSFDQGVYGYSTDGRSWTFETVDQTVVEYFGNDPVDSDWGFSDVDYNGVGWMFSVGDTEGGSPPNGGGVYITDLTATVTSARCFSMNTTYKAAWNGSAWYMEGDESIAGVNTNLDPRNGTFAGPIDPWSTSIQDLGIEGGSTVELAGGNGYLAVSDSDGHVAWSDDNGSTWQVTTPIPYTRTISSITQNVSAQIALSGSGANGTSGEKVIISGSSVSGYNGTFYWKIQGNFLLYTDQALTTPFDTSGLAPFTGTATLTWSNGQYIDAMDYINGYFYIGNDDEQIARTTNFVTWTIVDDQGSSEFEYWNDIAGFVGTGGTETDRLVNGAQTLVLNANGSVTFPDGSIQTTAYTAADSNIWVQTFVSETGSPTDIVAIAISVEYDSAGNVIALFSHYNDNAPGTYYSVGKYTTAGVKIWTARFAAGVETDGWGLAVSGNYIYVAGRTLPSSESGYRVSTLTKLNSSDGTIEWSKQYDFGYVSNSQVVDVASDGDPVMVGYASNGTDDYVTTTKVDAEDGSVIWSRALNGQGDELAYGMAVGPTGEVVAIGYMSQLGQEGDTDNHMLVVKYASDGTIAWQKAILFDAGYDCRGADADIDSEGNIYVTGSYQYDSEFTGTTSALSILKLDSGGVKQWSRRVTGTCETFGVSVVVGADDKLYLSGVTAFAGYTGVGEPDLNNGFTWVAAKYGFDGTVEWQRLIDHTDSWSFAGVIWIGEGGGSNLAVKDGYVVLGGGFGNDAASEDPRATVVQVSATGDVFTTGAWAFTAASFSGVLDSSASDITVSNAVKTDTDNASNISVATVTPEFDSSAFLIGTLYTAGGSSDRLINGEYELVLGSTGALTLPQGGIISETEVNSSHSILLTPYADPQYNPDMAVKIYPTFNDDDHIHITAGNPGTVDLFLGDDDQYVKLEADGGNVCIGTDSANHIWQFDTTGNLTLPVDGIIKSSDGSTYGGSAGVLGANIGAVAPTTVNGSLWYDTTDGRTYVRVSSTWVDAAPQVLAPVSTYLGNLTVEDTTIFSDLSGWTFVADGNLTLPQGGVIDETPAGETLTLAGAGLAVVNQTYIKTSPTLYTGSDGVTVELIGGVIWYCIQNGDAKYTSATGTGLDTWVNSTGGLPVPTGTINGLPKTVNITVGTETWAFGGDGNLTLPANCTIKNTSGTVYKVAPTYGSFYSNVTQTNNSVGDAIAISYNVTDLSNGVSITGTGATEIRIAAAGIYNIQFSAQVRKTDNGADTIYVWLDKNGTRVDNSATNLYLVGSSAAGKAAWNFVVNAAANDYYRLMWMSEDSHVEIVAVTAGAVVPAIPSVILTVVPVGT